MSENVFIFWDNSNIFISAKTVARQREGIEAYNQIRIDFENLYKLAHGERNVEFALAVGSIPPEMEHLWNSIEKTGVKVELLERGGESGKEQAVDQAIQVHMLRKTIDYNGNPGTVVLLSGDGKGFFNGVGFHADLERMHNKGWRIEVLAWETTCSQLLEKWVKDIGVFIPLENWYDSISFRTEWSTAIRQALPIDISNRQYS